MFRRNFITRLAISGAATMGAARAANSKTVTYHIKGFTCITCAIGLDTLLAKETGVVQAKSSYPDATSTIEYRPSETNEDKLKVFIAETGFRAT